MSVFNPGDYEGTGLHAVRERAWEMWLSKSEWELVDCFAIIAYKAGMIPESGAGPAHERAALIIQEEGDYQFKGLRFSEGSIELLCDPEQCPGIEENYDLGETFAALDKGESPGPGNWSNEFYILATQHPDSKPAPYGFDEQGNMVRQMHVPTPHYHKLLPRAIEYAEQHVPNGRLILPLLYELRGRINQDIYEKRRQRDEVVGFLAEAARKVGVEVPN